MVLELTLKYDVTVKSDLTMEAFCCGSKVNLEQLKLRYNSKLVNFVQLRAVFQKLEEQYDSCCTITNEQAVSQVAKTLELPSLGHNKTVVFVVEQLKLVLKELKGRRFFPGFLSIAVLLHQASPACYRQMLEDGVI